MDPVANLAEQRELAAAILHDTIPGHDDVASMAVRLAELVQALDEWRRAGGFDPYTVAP